MSEWISVKDRLPNEFEPVIVCRKGKNGRPTVESGCIAIGGLVEGIWDADERRHPLDAATRAAEGGLDHGLLLQPFRLPR